jgi:hypothetical protein
MDDSFCLWLILGSCPVDVTPLNNVSPYDVHVYAYSSQYDVQWGVIVTDCLPCRNSGISVCFCSGSLKSLIDVTLCFC